MEADSTDKAGYAMSMVIGVDASRSRSGGAKAHLIGIFGSADPRSYSITQVHLWAYQSLLDELPDREWLVKHCPPSTRRSLPVQLWWQFRTLARDARTCGCDLLLSSDAGTVCRFEPSVVISQDMLSYEPGEMSRYGLSRMRARLLALRYVQAWSMKRANGVIFLSRYAAGVIQKMTGPLDRVAVIPHGVGSGFRKRADSLMGTARRAWRCIYVSQADLYKHQWHVVRAIAVLRGKGYDLDLQLVGGGSGRPEAMLQAELARSDPSGAYVTRAGFIPQKDLPALFDRSDIFVFASSCENMPNTLIEGMASGLPVASSDRGPMPEVLGDGGVYFDPEDPDSIASAVERLIQDENLRESVSSRAIKLAGAFSWERCADETWTFLRDTATLSRKARN